MDEFGGCVTAERNGSDEWEMQGEPRHTQGHRVAYGMRELS